MHVDRTAGFVDEVAEAFVEKFATKVASLKVADPRLENAPLGAVIDAGTISRVNSLIEDALTKGAKLITGGVADSVLMPATVLDEVIPAMNIYHEESFGPVISIIRAADESEAIRIANDTDYGLSASVFTGFSQGAESCQTDLFGHLSYQCGYVHDEAQMPFGGMGASGYGRFGGKAGIDSFTQLRWITLDTEPRQYPI